jgi:hypothetical protein
MQELMSLQMMTMTKRFLTTCTAKCVLPAMSVRFFTHTSLVKRQKTNTLTLPL